MLVTETPPGTPNGFGVTLENLLLGQKFTTIFTDRNFIKHSKRRDTIFAQVPNHYARKYAVPFVLGITPEWRGKYSKKWLKKKIHGNVSNVYAFVYCTQTLKFGAWIAEELGVNLIIHITDFSNNFIEKNNLEIIKRSSDFIVISERMKKVFQEFIPDKFISVIHNGAAKKCFNLVKKQNANFNKDNPFKVVYIGSIYKEMHSNSIEDILFVINKLYDEGLPIEFHGYGNIEPKDFLNEFTIRKGINHHGIIMPLEKKWGIMQSSDCFVIPSTFSKSFKQNYQYSFPTKLCEYLGSGKPTLVYAPEDSELFDFINRNKLNIILKERSKNMLEKIFRSMIKDYAPFLKEGKRASLLIKASYENEILKKKLYYILQR